MNKGLRNSLLIQLIAILIIGSTYLITVPFNLLRISLDTSIFEVYRIIIVSSSITRFGGILLLIGGLIGAIMTGKEMGVRKLSIISLILIIILAFVRTFLLFTPFLLFPMKDLHTISFLMVSPFGSILMICLIFLVGMPLFKLRAGKFIIPAMICYSPIIVTGPILYAVSYFLGTGFEILRIIHSIVYSVFSLLSLILLVIGFIYAMSQLKKDPDRDLQNKKQMKYSHRPAFG